ncbi:unnamed protein product, partial [Ostreobium quekettii]
CQRGDWASFSVDLLDKIHSVLDGKRGGVFGKYFLKSARLVNKHWSGWANHATKCVKVPIRSRLRSFARLCSGSRQRPREISDSDAAWMTSGSAALRHGREMFFAKLGIVDMLRVVVAKFVGVEQLTLPHNLQYSALALPLLGSVKHLRYIALSGGSLKLGSLAWLGAVESLRCLTVHPTSRQSEALWCYWTIVQLTHLQGLELSGPGFCFDNLAWLRDVTSLKKLCLNFGWHSDGEVLGYVSHMTSLNDLALHGFLIADEDLAQLRALVELTSLTFEDCRFSTPDVLTCLSTLCLLSSFTALYCSNLDLRYLSGLPSLRTLHVTHDDSRDPSWIAAMTCLTCLKVDMGTTLWPRLEQWGALKNLRALELLTIVPCMDLKLDILRDRFPAAEVVERSC